MGNRLALLGKKIENNWKKNHLSWPPNYWNEKYQKITKKKQNRDVMWCLGRGMN